MYGQVFLPGAKLMCIVGTGAGLIVVHVTSCTKTQTLTLPKDCGTSHQIKEF